MKLQMRLVVATLVVVPALAHAQAAQKPPKYEFGSDFSLEYQKPDATDAFWVLSGPGDLRLGFPSQSNVSYEGRLLLTVVKGTGSTSYSIHPGMNVQFRLAPGTGLHNQMGPFAFVGGSALIVGDRGGLVPFLEGGVGTRRQVGNAALLFEGFVRNRFEADLDCCFYAQNLTIGAHVGMSFYYSP